jgi:toxin ParE1/3/4
VDDLESIVGYIAIDDSQKVESYGNKLVDRALGAKVMPRKGRVVPEFGDSNIRELIQGNYRIVYRVRDKIKTVDILRFWHAAQGTPEI